MQRSRRVSVTLPPLLTKVPATKTIPIAAPRRDGVRKYDSAPCRVPGTSENLRERALSLANRRHTVIQCQLTAARFNSSLNTYSHRTAEQSIWDEYVKVVSCKRDTDGAQKRHGLEKDLEQLSMRIETACPTRRSDADTNSKPVESNAMLGVNQTQIGSDNMQAKGKSGRNARRRIRRDLVLPNRVSAGDGMLGSTHDRTTSKVSRFPGLTLPRVRM